jgi:hypothetical protein
MEKTEALEEFLKSLKTSLNTSSIYFKEHPVFLACVENLHHKVCDIFKFYNPLNIEIAPKSLFIGGKTLEKNRLYVELAEFLHPRKVKSISFTEGITVQELMDFLSVVSLPPKDILKNAGLSALSSNMTLPHILIEELDYSEMLKSSKKIIKSLLSDKSLAADKLFPEVEPLIADLGEKEIAGMLYEELSSDKHFDVLSFKLFAKLFGKKDQQLIASSLMDEITAHTDNKSQLVQKLKELFSAPPEGVSEVYHRTLSKLLEEPAEAVGRRLERKLLEENYRNLLINILVMEQEKEQLEFVSAKISQLLENIDMAKETQYLKNLLSALGMRRKDKIFESSLKILEMSVSNAAEKAILGGGRIDIGDFIEFFKKSSYDLSFYMNKIFVEDKTDACILQLLFKFFPENLDVFYINIHKRAQDVNFLKNILESLKRINSLLTLNILKYIFSIADGFIKIEALKSMQAISYIDKEFISGIIKKGDSFSKKQALLVLEKDSTAQENALKAMLEIPNPFGLRNNLLLQNLRIIDELSLKEAKPYLSILSRKGFFSGSVKRYAQEILKKHDYGKN